MPSTPVIALIIAVIALVIAVGHALLRDSDNGGPAHSMGFGSDGSWRGRPTVTPNNSAPNPTGSTGAQS